MAARGDQAEMLALLIDKGADVEARDNVRRVCDHLNVV